MTELGYLGDLTVETPDYMEQLLRVLDAAPRVEALIAEARRQAHAMLTANEPVPGWKLVPKRGTRKWNYDEATIVRILRNRFRLKKALVYVPTLKSPAQIEKLLPKGKLVPQELATSVSSGTTLAPDTDPRPAVITDAPFDLEAALTESLALGAKEV